MQWRNLDNTIDWPANLHSPRLLLCSQKLNTFKHINGVTAFQPPLDPLLT